MHEVYVFYGEQGHKLERQLSFCFELDVAALLLRHKIVTVHKNSRDFLLGWHHLSNKAMFLL